MGGFLGSEGGSFWEKLNDYDISSKIQGDKRLGSNELPKNSGKCGNRNGCQSGAEKTFDESFDQEESYFVLIGFENFELWECIK